MLYSTDMTDDLLEFAKAHDERVMKSATFKRIADKYGLPNMRVLDIGCGAGSHMQRFGDTSVGITSNPDEVTLGENIDRDIRLGNVEFLADSLSREEKFDVIWASNIYEHLLSPHAFLVNLKRFSHQDTLIIMGTPMVPLIPAELKLRAFRGSLATAHINFFNYQTYRLTVAYAGWTILTTSSFYFKNPLLNRLTNPFVPTLYVVAKNNPDYRYHEKKLKEWEHDPHYQPLIEIMNPGWKKPSSE